MSSINSKEHICLILRNAALHKDISIFLSVFSAVYVQFVPIFFYNGNTKIQNDIDIYIYYANKERKQIYLSEIEYFPYSCIVMAYCPALNAPWRIIVSSEKRTQVSHFPRDYDSYKEFSLVQFDLPIGIKHVEH